MTHAQRTNIAGWLIAGLWSAAPLYPGFISLLPVAPPGIALLPMAAGAALLLAVVAAIGGVLVLLVADGGLATLREPLPRAVWLFAGVTAAVAVLGFAPVVGLLYALFMACTGIGMTALVHFARDPGFARRTRIAMLLSSAAAALFALGLWYFRVPAALYAVGNGRAIGTFVLPGELAGYAGMFLPYAAGTALCARDGRERTLAIGAAVILASAMLATLSRAGLAGLALGGLILAARFGRRVVAAYGAVLAGVAIIVARHFFDAHHNPAEDTNRLGIWLAALRMFTLFPLTGTGPGGFAKIYPLVRLPDGELGAFHAHSFVLATLAESGVAGIAALLYLWWTFGRECRRAYRDADERGRLMAWAIIAGFAGTWLQSTIDVVQILILGIWIPFMGATLAALRAGRREPAAESGEPGGAAGAAKIAVLTAALAVSGCGGTGGQHTTHPHRPQHTARVAASVSPSPAARPKVPPATPLPDVVLHARRQGQAPVSIVVTQTGRRIYTIDADANETERTPAGAYFSTFTNPKVTFFNHDGTKMHATAAKAQVDGTSKVVTMLGNVLLSTQDGTTLACDRMRYDDRSGTVESWTGVVVTTKQGDTLRGDHLTGDVHLQDVHIDGAQS